MRARVVALGIACALVAPAWVGAQEQTPVPPPAPADTTRAITDARTAFNRITRENYLRRHAFSLDHFLEFEPGGVLARLGPNAAWPAVENGLSDATGSCSDFLSPPVPAESNLRRRREPGRRT